MQGSRELGLVPSNWGAKRDHVEASGGNGNNPFSLASLLENTFRLQTEGATLLTQGLHKVDRHFEYFSVDILYPNASPLQGRLLNLKGEAWQPMKKKNTVGCLTWPCPKDACTWNGGSKKMARGCQRYGQSGRVVNTRATALSLVLLGWLRGAFS